MHGLTFQRRFPDQANLTLGQIPKPAVYEFRRTRRRAGGEVVAVDQRHPQTAVGRVSSHPAAGDPAADDHHVEALGFQPIEVMLA